MKINFDFEQFGTKIRSVQENDAEFIISLRANPQLSSFIGDINPDIEAQKNWIKSYLKKVDDYYFVIESLNKNAPVGLVGIYAIDFEKKIAEWGRWIILPNSMAAASSALAIYQFGFEVLKLETIFCRTLCENTKVLSFHKNSGATEKGIQEKAIKVKNELRDVVIYEMNSIHWEENKQKLIQTSKKAERFV